MAPPPRLMPELVAEILLRLPTDEPASLFRAAAVSRTWNALVSNDGALRMYREHHGVPPLMGFFQNLEYAGEERPLFVPTTDRSPPFFASVNLDCDTPYPLTLDCRHGRVLVHTVNPLRLLVWNPITDHREEVLLPFEHGVALYYNDFTGAVLCAEDGCDHLDCAGGPFRVVFAATDNEDIEHEEQVTTWACVYSSQTGAWTAPTIIHPGAVMPNVNVMGPALLLGDSLYFPFDLLGRRVFLVYRLAQHTLSLLEGPPMGGRGMALVAVGNGMLGVATVEGNNLQIWSMGDEGAWMKSKSIDSIIPGARGYAEIHVVGYAEGADIAFVSTNNGVSVVYLKSGKVRPVSNMSCLKPVLPYVTFFTRGIGANVNG